MMNIVGNLNSQMQGVAEHYANEFKAKRAADRAKFAAEDAPFAKIVSTANGAAIMINGDVLTLSGPRAEFYVDAIVSVLRSTGSGPGSGTETIEGARD